MKRFASLILSVCAVFLALGFVTTSPTVAHADENAQNPCMLTDEQRAQYEADGTLYQRVEFFQALHNDQLSPALAAQGALRAQGVSLFSSNVPSYWKSGMATTGHAHVLAIRVSFPDCEFDQQDTLAALQSLIGPTGQGNDDNMTTVGVYPFDSLSAYYKRASYGALNITGEAFDYQAQHERSYYNGNIQGLFKEAVSAIDQAEDLSRFDANADGDLDAVYIHFAGPDSGWGSEWWSYETSDADLNIMFQDGTLRLANRVMLAGNASDPHSANTMIHETGHVLGLPDLYSYDNAKNPTGQRTGM